MMEYDCPYCTAPMRAARYHKSKRGWISPGIICKKCGSAITNTYVEIRLVRDNKEPVPADHETFSDQFFKVDFESIEKKALSAPTDLYQKLKDSFCMIPKHGLGLMDFLNKIPEG